LPTFLKIKKRLENRKKRFFKSMHETTALRNSISLPFGTLSAVLYASALAAVEGGSEAGQLLCQSFPVYQLYAHSARSDCTVVIAMLITVVSSSSNSDSDYNVSAIRL